VCHSEDEVIHAYLIGFETKPEGYAIFHQRWEPGECNLYIRNWVTLTPRAGQRLWMFVADHRSIVDKVQWRGSALDPLLLLLPEQSDRIKNLERWLLRIVDVPKALEKRGYPLGIEAELHLDIRDDVLLENNGQFVLKVSEGRGEVTRGGRGNLRLDVRGLAPLYTGLFSPYQLQLLGQLEADNEALSVASNLFVGQQPWMSDHF
jgi:predicted acetyltransferase